MRLASCYLLSSYLVLHAESSPSHYLLLRRTKYRFSVPSCRSLLSRAVLFTSGLNARV